MGGDTVSLQGTNFEASQTTVTIDGVACTKTAETTTSFTCTAGARIGLSSPSLQVEVGTKGYAVNGGHSFLYINKWSEPATWGLEFAPREGDSIHIPKGQNLLVDVDEVKQLGAVLVEGSIIFLPDGVDTHERTFAAEYIFLNGGYMEVGTETAPYTS